MDPEFWQSRWSEGRIGFHRDVPNPHLVRHGPALRGWPGRGFLPLCGKSVDLVWLAREGVHAVGNELVEVAVEQFFRENGLTDRVTTRSGFRVHEADPEGFGGTISIWQGDFFELPTDQLGRIDWVFDRAAFIALPEPRREAYAKKIRELSPGATDLLLVTMEYPRGGLRGPPFSVPADEVRARFADATIEIVEHGDVGTAYPQLVEQGLPWLHETVWRIRLEPPLGA